jgi:hypothetical protein
MRHPGAEVQALDRSPVPIVACSLQRAGGPPPPGLRPARPGDSSVQVARTRIRRAVGRLPVRHAGLAAISPGWLDSTFA